MKNLLHYRNILSINEFSRDDIELVLHVVNAIKHQPPHNALKHRTIASCFFEPSTRTRLSFEAATVQLGGHVIGFSESENTSVKKGETLEDSMKVIAGYADLIVMRHPLEGSVRMVSELVNIPVINAGDGANQHPTQALLDLYTIKECQGKLDELNIGFVGDLKHARTIHSLVQACCLFNMRLFFISQDELTLPDYLCDILRKNGIRFSFHNNIEEIMHRIDILYMTRLQKERMINTDIENENILTTELLHSAKDNLKILHPLPRLNEIDKAVDNTSYAYYFQQAKNGLFVRQALLTLVLNSHIHFEENTHEQNVLCVGN